MFVIAGVTGHTGRVAADTLLAQYKPVTVLVRSEDKGREWEARGAKVAVADLTDANTLRSVFEGAEGAYILFPPNAQSTDPLEAGARLADSIAQVAKETGLPHIVFLSSIGAQHETGTGPIRSLHYGEKALAGAAPKLTFIRAAYFLENWEPVIPLAKSSGALHTFLERARKIPMVATRDIGRVVAEVLSNPPDGRQIIELAGPEDYSPEDIASAVSGILHRDIQVQQDPMAAVLPMFTSMGVSEAMALLYQEMIEGANSGHVAFEGTGTEFRRGDITPGQLFEPAAA